MHVPVDYSKRTLPQQNIRPGLQIKRGDGVDRMSVGSVGLAGFGFPAFAGRPIFSRANPT